MEVPKHEEIVEAIDAFLARHQMAHTRFGAEATRDANLVNDLRAGRRSPRLSLLHKIKDFMDARDAEREAGGADHDAPDTSQAQHASCGSETNISAPSGALSPAVGLPGSATTAAEGEGACSLPGGLAA